MMRWELRVKNFLNRGVFPLKNIALKHIPMYHRERAGMGALDRLYTRLYVLGCGFRD